MVPEVSHQSMASYHNQEIKYTSSNFEQLLSIIIANDRYA